MDTELSENSDSPSGQENAADAPADSSPVHDAAPESSPGEKAPTLLDAVEDALKETRGEAEPTATEEVAEASAEAATGEGAQAPEGEGTEGAVGGDDPDADLPFHKHPRFQQVIAERNQLRDGSTRWDALQAFMTSNNVSQQGAAEALDLAAMVEKARSGAISPEEAIKRIESVVGSLYELAGTRLAPEVQARVTSGELDENTARELSQEKARAAQATAYSQQQQEHAANAAQASIHQANVAAVATWDRNMRTTDPDYSVKSDLVERIMQAEFARTGYPQSPAAAVAVADAAHAEAGRMMDRVRPATPPAPTRSAPSPVNSRGGAALKPEPTTLFEAAEAALLATRSA